MHDLPPCYAASFWFVYQYVADMEVCHLSPMETHGVFGANSAREALRCGRRACFLPVAL